MKKYIKYMLYRLRLLRLANDILYRYSQIKNRNKNQAFRKQHPGIPIPPDHFLHETYRLDYRKYIEDGRLAAKEIAEWCSPYLSLVSGEILDWGCGTGRVTRHLGSLFPQCIIHGCDSNADMISWNRQHYTGILFSVSGHTPPVPYNDTQFGLITGFSVFTHIAAGLQESWLAELHRILQPDGILILSTHGAAYEYQLVPAEKHILRSEGIYTRGYPVPGHRIVSTYHDAVQFRELLEKQFIVLEHHNGSLDPAKIGGQDLWILRRKN